MTAINDDLELIVIEPEDFVVVEEIPEIIDLSYLGSRDYQQFEAEIIRLTNKERTSRGLHPLTKNGDLTQSALAHTMDMAENKFISHTGSDGSNVADRVNRTSYRWIAVGENLAMGQRAPAEAVQGWMDSPGHRANLLNDQFYEIGVAYIEADIRASNGQLWRGGYWTQNFGTRLTAENMAPVALKQLRDIAHSIIKPKNDDIEIVILDE